jgi:hypothetical protein
MNVNLKRRQWRSRYFKLGDGIESPLAIDASESFSFVGNWLFGSQYNVPRRYAFVITYLYY